MLRAFLALRAAFNLLAGVALLIWMAREGSSGLARGGWYALLDGALTLAIAAALLPARGRWLVVLAAADGVLRLFVGAFIVANPGFEQMPLTTALVLVVLTIAFITLGLVGLLYAWLGLRRQAGASGEAPLLWPAIALSLCTLLLGVGFALSFVDQQLRLLLGWYAIAIGVILGVAAFRLGRATVRTAPPAGITG